jgi:isocitrate dehydrogenase kinase/phosphatase
MARTVQRMGETLGEKLTDRALWADLKKVYARAIDGDDNPELATTFYNSATRKIFSTVGVDAKIEFLDASPEPPEPEPGSLLRFGPRQRTSELLRELLEAYGLGVAYRSIDEDAERAARRLDHRLRTTLGTSRIDMLETVREPFFRGKGAYVVGRIRQGDTIVPLVLALRNTDTGVSVDAVLTRPNEVSILFSFTRTYFHVATDIPRELVGFLKSIMPLKPLAELYIALGFNKHGKTELFRGLRQHMARTPARFEIAAGEPGMVMLVFGLPGYDMVFKVIRDRFRYPKRTTRRQVMDRYRLVFRRDRVGRLVDAQEFEYLLFDRSRFSEALLEELLAEAGDTVSIDGNEVIIRHVYTERKVTPLNLYLRRATWDQARGAVLDYGNAIKELAAANIFPGDFLLKNFGVTRHGRVVFYDYDELCLLTDCRFRALPSARCHEDEMAEEPWFTVGENDIFPEEFRRFLGLPAALRERFIRHHSDLFDPEFWKEVQERHNTGEIPDFFPYPPGKRLHPSRTAGVDPSTAVV